VRIPPTAFGRNASERNFECGDSKRYGEKGHNSADGDEGVGGFVNGAGEGSSRGFVRPLPRQGIIGGTRGTPEGGAFRMPAAFEREKAGEKAQGQGRPVVKGEEVGGKLGPIEEAGGHGGTEEQGIGTRKKGRQARGARAVEETFLHEAGGDLCRRRVARKEPEKKGKGRRSLQAEDRTDYGSTDGGEGLGYFPGDGKFCEDEEGKGGREDHIGPQLQSPAGGAQRFGGLGEHSQGDDCEEGDREFAGGGRSGHLCLPPPGSVHDVYLRFCPSSPAHPPPNFPLRVP